MALSNAGLEDWMIQSKQNCLSFLCGFSQTVCSTVLVKFLKWTPELSEGSIFFMDSCLIVDLCWGMEAGISYYAILVTSFLSLTFDNLYKLSLYSPLWVQSFWGLLGLINLDVHFPTFGKFSAIFPLNRFSIPFFFWDSHNAYIVILIFHKSCRLPSLIFFSFSFSG